MRVIGIYESADFPKLVVESKKSFASKYGLQGDYWQHFDSAERPEVLAYLKTNLQDLANHYHALYQDKGLEEEKPANYAEALVWYRAFLASFPQDTQSPGINYQLADLLLENADFGEAALEYERTAYSYAPHERASAAGYAAIFAHREQLEARDPRAGAGAQARDRRELAQVCRHVPRARACGRRARRCGRGSLCARGFRGGRNRRAHADRALSDGRARAAAHGVDRRRAFVGRARRLPRGRARVRRGAGVDAGRGRRNGKRSSTISRRRSTSRPSRPTRRRTIAPPRATSCGSRNARRRRRSGRPRSTTRRPRS